MKKIIIISIILGIAIILTGCPGLFNTDESNTAVRKIAYVAVDSHDPCIYTINPDGSEKTRITFENEWRPHISPDGTRIIFSSNRDGNGDLYIMNIDGTNKQQLTTNDWDDWDPCWSPDGTQIAFTSNREGHIDIWKMDLDGSNLTQLTTDDLVEMSPTWSANGEISYTMKRTVDENDNTDMDIWIMDIDGANKSRITDGVSSNYDSVFSPDGSEILYISNITTNWDIFLMNNDGTGKLNITENLLSDEGSAYFSANGQQIVFISDSDGDNNIYTMTLATGDITQITDDDAIEIQVFW